MAERVSIVTEITFNLLATLYGAVDKSGYTPSPNIKKLTLMKCRIMFPFSPFKNKTLSFYCIFLENEVSSVNQYELVAFPSLPPPWVLSLPAGTASGRKSVDTCYSKSI